MEELNLDNILNDQEIEDLFLPEDEENSQEDIENTTKNTEEEIEQNNLKESKQDIQEDNTTEINPEELFEEESESVGSEEEKDKEDSSSRKDGASPKTIYSSIAKALKEDGVFPDLTDDNFANITSPEDFLNLVEMQIKSGLDERQRRIDEALSAGVEATEIKKYENTLSFLDSIKDDALRDESDKGEKLRKDLIYQDFINRGYSDERAKREVKKSLDAGTDIEDAKEALNSNQEYFREKYESLIQDAKKEEEAQRQEIKKQSEQLKKSIIEDKELLKGLSLDTKVRQQIYDSITKPVYKDPDTGDYYTAIQKYEREHRIEFLKNVGLIYTLTNGFKDFGQLFKQQAKKEIKKGLRELENTLNNTSRAFDGSLKYTSGISEDKESFLGKGWDLDI